MTRRCLVIIESVTTETGEYIPCVAEDGVSGYYRTEWKWGKDFAAAQKHARQLNERMGISEQEETRLILQSMKERKRK